MPRPSRPCSHLPGDRNDPGRCAQLTDHPTGLCGTHRAAMHAHIDAHRPNSHHRGYDTDHRNDTRQAKARGQRCQHPGCTRTDVHRDHIDGNPANNRPDNIAWLCQKHHSAKTLQRDVQRDARGRILPKRDRTPQGKAKRSSIRTVEL